MTLSNANPFKRALRDGRTQIGMWLALANPYTAEICATAGFDWLLIDGEHAPNDVRSILAQLQVLAAYPASPVVRAVTGDSVLIKQLLDIGAQTLLIPMVESAEQARELVAAVRYPPRGIRGIGASISRVSRWMAIPDYLVDGENEICLLVQVESKKGIDNLAAIAGVEGIDGVFLGPSDLAASYGHRGNPGHPEVVAAIEGAIATIIAAGNVPGLLTPDETLARRYLELGATFVAVGTEATLLANATRALAKSFSRSL
ncbi:MAG TPA: 4-hydroxy-2-oxoheptanedioate aldolase [Candidatus Lustribacter sp.]|jgi:4-hydroxy-2-oxoheptanedioate aldolase|nr:4-hydroxy-2-oxoheptanedioate aldolase [Candidatus Lustribacter sp.]